jgi:hypothetical protein
MLAGSGALGLGMALQGGEAASATTRALAQARALKADASGFLPVDQLREWHEQLDALGMRATGSPAHEGFIDTLIERLTSVGVHDVHTEPVPFTRWLVGHWGLSVGETTHPTASYIPYSGQTSAQGYEGPLAYVDSSTNPPAGSLAGQVVLFDVPGSAITYGTMESIGYGTYDPAHLLDPTATYSRPWGGVTTLITFLDALEASGARACVGIIPLPAAGARGSYYPYDGTIRNIPGVFVDSATGAGLKAQAQHGASTRVILTASVERTTSRNVVGTIPGQSDELIILNSHTDGPNAVEDNGPDSIVSMAHYLTRLPMASRPRSFMVSFTTGHFHGGVGQVSFVEEHRDTSLPRTACAVTLEHLGALEWDLDASGEMALTGRPELGVIFVPENKAMAFAALAALNVGDAGPALVLRPYVASAGSPNGYGWPGEGTQLWTDGHVMTMNYITGPTYLLNWGIPTVHKCDFQRVHREIAAFTSMVLGLSRTPKAELTALDLPPL